MRIDAYTNGLVESLLRFEIETLYDEKEQNYLQDNFHVRFLRQLTTPLDKAPLEVLKTI